MLNRVEQNGFRFLVKKSCQCFVAESLGVNWICIYRTFRTQATCKEGCCKFPTIITRKEDCPKSATTPTAKMRCQRRRLPKVSNSADNTNASKTQLGGRLAELWSQNGYIHLLTFRFPHWGPRRMVLMSPTKVGYQVWGMGEGENSPLPPTQKKIGSPRKEKGTWWQRLSQSNSTS